jgi:hypothetical protein
MKNTLRICSVALGLLALGGVAYAGFATGDRPGGGGHAKAPAARHLTVSGHVEGLYPGRETTLWLTVHNPFGRNVAVRSVRTTVQAGAGSCSGAELSVSSRSFSSIALRIAPHRSRRVPVAVKLRTADPACQDARWPLRYHVTADGTGGKR